MTSRAHVFTVEAIRRIKSHPGASIVQTRLIVSFGVLLLANLTAAFEDPAQISRIILAYIILTVSPVLLWPTALELKRVRVIPILFDLFAISLLVASTGGLESSWFVLYLFPVLSASRYLGPTWTIAVAVLATFAYGFASFVFLRGQAPPISFWLRAATLAGAALTAANLARTKERSEAKLVSAIEKIDREILSDTELERVMHSILDAAMDLTDSDLSAIVLVDGEEMTATFTAAKTSERKTPNGWERDKAEAGRLVQQHFRQVLSSRRPLCLPEKHLLATALAVLGSWNKASQWPARLVSLEIDETPFGVLGVFSRRRLHYYTSNDLRKLSSMASLVAIAQKNAKLFHELASRELESKELLRNLVYNSPDPIIVIDKTGKVQNFNRECEKIWGLSEQELLGTPVENYYESAEHAREVGRALWKAEGHTIRDYRARIKTAKEDIIPIRLSATLLVDKNGQKLGSISVFKDEREILRQEEEKLRAEKLATLARLAQTTGHDIKHDIATVLNYVDSLERDARGDPRTLHAYSAIRGATAAALSKVQNMLLTSKPKPPEKQVVSFKSILTEFEASIAHQASATHIEFSANYPDSDPLVLAEPEQMRQLITNLFGNSLDAIKSARANGRRSAGRITLIVEAEKDALLLSWRDDGCGMSEDAKTNAFIPFFTTKDTGIGLGLFITKTIIENHGGSITVESEEGGGVCFRIALPLFREFTGHAAVISAGSPRRHDP